MLAGCDAGGVDCWPAKTRLPKRTATNTLIESIGELHRIIRRRLKRERVMRVLAADKRQRVPFVLCPQSTQAILTGGNGEVTHSCQNYGAAAVFFTKKEPCVPDGGILAFGINLRSPLNSDMFQIALRAVPEDSLKAFVRIFRRSSK